MDTTQKYLNKTIITLLIIASLTAFLFTGCTTTKEGYEIKDYPYGSTGAQIQEKPSQPAQPTQDTTPTKPAVTVEVPKTSNQTTGVIVAKPAVNTTPIKTGTGTITQSSKTISLEHLDLANVNVITVTGTKDVELTSGTTRYLFQNPRVDTDGTLCFIKINGVDHIVSMDGTYPISGGLTLELRSAIPARSVENSQCEFIINK